MTWPKFEQAVAAVLALSIGWTICFLAIRGLPISEAMWGAFGAVLMWYFRGRTEQPK